MNDLQEKKSLIYLIGFMGSGKSTVGPILANTIGYAFIDLDHYIEIRTHKKIGEIFAAEGEKKFRNMERETLRSLLASSATVISLGGGTVTNDEILKLIKTSGVVVYLKSDVEQIFNRLRTKGDRPMLRDENGNLLDGEHLRLKITTLLEQREVYYNQADIIIHTDDKRIGNTVDELAKKLRKFIPS